MAQHAQVVAQKCDICKEDISKVFCYECKHFICQSCNSWHGKFPATKRHTVTDSQYVDRSTLMLTLVCEDHKLEFAHYCRDCKCLICTTCVTSVVHKGHSFTDIAEVAETSRGDVKNRLEQIKNNIKTLSGSIEAFKTTKQAKLQTGTENFIKEVTKVSQGLVRIIETVTETHLTDASNFLVHEKQQLLCNLSKLEKSHREYYSLHEKFEQILGQKHDVSFFLKQILLTKEFELLDDIPTPEEHEEPRDIEPFKQDCFVKSVIEQIESKYNTRLNAIAGDPYRPMKIAEKFSEMYDNGWTDSMEALEDLDHGEEECVKILLHFLTDSYEECGRLVAELDSHILKAVIISTCEQDTNENGENLQDQKIPGELLKPMKELRKKLAENNVEKIQKKLPDYLMKTRDLTEEHISVCSEFVADCIKYALMMQIQDPPVYIEWDFPTDTKIDTNILRSYTKAGDHIDFVVWPVLYLHKGGPVLNKGFVQPKSGN